MTDIEKRALELVNAACEACGDITFGSFETAKRYYPTALAVGIAALEAHEADKARHAAELREQAERFSEAINTFTKQAGWTPACFLPFVPAPVDELAKQAWAVAEACVTEAQFIDRINARGLAIVKKEAVNG